MRIMKTLIVAVFVAALGFLMAGPAAADPSDMIYNSVTNSPDMPYN